VTPGTYEKQNEYYLKWEGVKGEEGVRGDIEYILKRSEDTQ